MNYKKSIKRKAIKLQNIDAKAGRTIRSISEAKASVENSNDTQGRKV